MRRALIYVGLIAAVAACSVEMLQPLPISITMTVDRSTVAVGDSVTFNIDAQGGNLRGVDIDYGDGRTESIPTVGARTAGIRRRHAYSAAGQYTTTATVADFDQGTRFISAAVRVQ